MFTKKDLKSGDHLILDDGREYILLRGTAIGDVLIEAYSQVSTNGSVITLSCFSEMLNHIEGENKNVMFVRRPVNAFKILEPLKVYRTVFENNKLKRGA